MHTFLSDAELRAIAARVAGARAGPWTSFVEGRDHTSGSNFIRTGPAASAGRILSSRGQRWRTRTLLPPLGRMSHA